MAYRLGVDIGGTFTDIALIDEATGQIYTGKVSSTPQDPSGGFMEAVQRLLAKQQIAAQDVAYIGPRHHGRHQRHHRRQGRADRLYHHRGLPRYAGNRPPDSPHPLRLAV